MEEKQAAVEITIDADRCRYSMYDPLGCKKCLQVCTAKVFATRPAHKRDFTVPLEQRVDPTIWVLVTPWADFCNGCGACIMSCPYDAISISIDGRVLKAQ